MDFTKNVLSSLLPTVPDSSLREPITISAVAPLFACYYVLALLVQLPRTFVFRVSLLPIVIWSGWHAATRYDLALRVALMLGWEDHWQIQGLNFALVVSSWPVPILLNTLSHMLLERDNPAMFAINRMGVRLKTLPTATL